MNLTLKTNDTGLLIEAETLRQLGIDGEVEVEIRREGHALVVEPARESRRQRLAEDLGRMMADSAEALPQLVR